MNNYQNQTPPPVLRNHHQHQQQQQLHHNNHHFSTTTTQQLTPSHHLHQQQQNHHGGLQHQQQQHHFTTPAAAPPLLPQSVATVVAVAPILTPQHHLQPLISNSLAIRQEIQRFESVHPSIYAIYDLIDLLPVTDAQIAQQIRDHVVCIEAIEPETKGLILNSQAKKAVRNMVAQFPCGWPERGIPPLAPYTNPDLEVHLAKSVVDSLIQMIRFRFDGLDDMEIKKLKVSYTFTKKVKFHFNFKELKAQASQLNTDTLIDMMRELGLSVRYEGTGPMEFSLQNLSIQGQFKYKMPLIFGSIKIYKFEAIVGLGSVQSNIGGILGNGRINELINDEIEYMVPAFINGNQEQISAMIEESFVPRVNAQMKGKKIWSLLGMIGGSSSECTPTPAPWLAEI